MSYAGDISCEDTFLRLKENSKAQLIDVRTLPEWTFVGVPDLSNLSKQAHTIDWQQFPTMQVNQEFISAVESALAGAGGGKDDEVYCLCRSGVRSIAAAEALTAAGFTKAFNVLAGFEGDRNEEGKRGMIAGWKHDGLPWMQK